MVECSLIVLTNGRPSCVSNNDGAIGVNAGAGYCGVRFGSLFGSVRLAPTTQEDFAHMCCAADLVAASMFLQRLETHEIRDMVASACRSASCLEQPDEVEDDGTTEEPHMSYVRVPRFSA